MRLGCPLFLLAFVAACDPAHAVVGSDAAPPWVEHGAPTTDGAATPEDAGPRARDAFVAAPGDGSVPLPTLGEPIELEPAQLGRWVWVTVPEMICGDGEAGGFAVNFTDASRDLVIYLQGGGICYDALTCAAGGAPRSVGATPLSTALDGSIRDGRGIFDRSDATNPFRDSNFVVVPHCTGDHHTGNAIGVYRAATWHHRGYTNITRMLERVVPTFSDAGRVVLSGFSAGGVGVTANYHQVATTFESVGRSVPYLVIDAGPFMRPPYLQASGQRTLRASWRLDDTVGSFCPSCLDVGFHDLYRVNAQLHPGLRASLICAYEDGVVRPLYGVLNTEAISGPRMREGLRDLATWHRDSTDPTTPGAFEFFFYAGDRHGALNVAALSATPGLVDFLNGQLADDAWSSVIP